MANKTDRQAELKQLEQKLEDQLALIEEGDQILANIKTNQVEQLQEVDRITAILEQRRESCKAIEELTELREEMSHLLRNHYGEEIRRGDHRNMPLCVVVRRYMERERNLALRQSWRYRLARWLTRDTIDKLTPPKSYI